MPFLNIKYEHKVANINFGLDVKTDTEIFNINLNFIVQRKQNLIFG